MNRFCGRCGCPHTEPKCPECGCPEFSTWAGVLFEGWKRRQKEKAKKPKRRPKLEHQGNLFDDQTGDPV